MKTDARTKKRENETLYILKVWATFSVIAIHFGFLGQIGVFYKVLARFAVPLFFMIS
ncbi:transmembrane protein [Streptococcus pneumoniae]|nr:transmembrane protein [Streptococcus pneumoniae]VQG59240.1 transmembrane protein [Streptococcus pneumoniae]VRB29988.1 transmembrane protein [Streptococcus pneumoniae]